MIIDEVQREPNLILAIKSVVDRQRPAVRGQFVLTGSANLLMMKRIGDSAEPSGAHFENLVLCDLLAWRDRHVPRASLNYWRTTTGQEVDFVLERQRQLLGVEVKAGPHPTIKDVRGLRAFLEEYPRNSVGAVVLHGGDESYWLDQKIIALPWWRVM